ncbi:hypothetical protein KA183_21255 [bacterium]|nr:hypothetical protein [bacterium]
MQGQKAVFFSQTLLAVIAPALSQVANTKAPTASIMITPDVSGEPINISVQFVGGRHGCGDEGTGVWAHTKGVYDDLRFDRAAANGDELVEPLLSYLTARLKDASVVSAIATFQPYPGGETIEAITAASQAL